MIKPIFVPLVLKATFPYGDELKRQQRLITESMESALAEVDRLLDDGWRILTQNPLESTTESGIVFFLRDDAECLIITEEGEALLEVDYFQDMDVSEPLEGDIDDTSELPKVTDNDPIPF